MIIYEQPTTEDMRLCLRLEHLFQQADENIESDNLWNSSLAIKALLEAVTLTDRADLKVKLTKSLTQNATQLASLKELPQVDKSKLDTLLNKLNGMIDHFHQSNGKFGQQLRDNDFLNNIRRHLYNPAGPCGFTVPAYQLWLQQPHKKRVDELQGWFGDFEVLKEVIVLLLKLTRESSEAKKEVAQSGFYQMALDPNSPLQLIRINISAKLHYYPEISAGRHRLSIRFFEPHIEKDGHYQSVTQDVPFELTCC